MSDVRSKDRLQPAIKARIECQGSHWIVSFAAEIGALGEPFEDVTFVGDVGGSKVVPDLPAVRVEILLRVGGGIQARIRQVEIVQLLPRPVGEELPPILLVEAL